MDHGDPLNHIRAALTLFRGRVPVFDGSGHTRLIVGGEPRGWVNAAVAAALGDMPTRFLVGDAAIRVLDDGTNAAARSAILQTTAEQLRQLGLVPGWRGELYSLLDGAGKELLRIERAAFRVFGLQSHAVHVNGFTTDGRIWIGRRSPKKPTDPGKLDNFAAGGLTAGELPDACAARELWEEAGVPVELSRHARGTGEKIRSVRPVKRGVHDEILLCYDVEVPTVFVPSCQDGEVAEFLLLSPAEAAERLAAGEFTWDAGLVTASWLERRLGLL
jgi:8-oxo-dGTP pyrophosphatase MutT (NUDIX family)